MSIIIQKYGGSSVSTPQKLCQVAQRIVQTYRQGHSVVVVVSAMGDTTNQLLKLAREVSPEPERRELDMLLTVGERISMSLLSMAIQDLGAPAVSFTGSQSGIITTPTHTHAKIIKVVPTRVSQALNEGKIVIIAGFQGVSEQLEITSLGRGGSDATAVAMAAALHAEYVEICSDVDGVYSADPRVASGAQRLSELSYDEMLTLADSGAKVLNAEAVEWAKRNRVEVRCVATADPRREGTSIKSSVREALHDSERGYHHPRIAAITHHPGLMRLSGSGTLPQGLSTLLAHHGCVDAVTHFTSMEWRCWIPLLNLHRPSQLMDDLRKNLASAMIETSRSWVTLVGRGLLGDLSALGDSLNTLHEITHQERGLVNQVSLILKDAQIEAHPAHFEPGSLRWEVSLDEAPRAIQLLHQHFIG